MDPRRSIQNRSVKLQVYLAFIANLTCLAPSMSLGFSAIALPSLMDDKNNNPNFLTKDRASWMASITAMLTPLGCIITGIIVDKYGRKNTLYAVNVCAFLGWSAIVLSSKITEHQFLLLIIGRGITGISCGMASMPATVYITEITVPKYRGMFTTWTTVSFAVGVLVVYCLGFVFKDDWGLIALIITFLPVLVLFLAITQLPESPVWLINNNKQEEAVISMCKLCGIKNYETTVALEEELQSLRKTDQGNTNLSFLNKVKFFAKPFCAKPLLLMTLFFGFQQFAGTFAILFYTVDVAKRMDPDLDPFVITVFVGITRFVGCLFMTVFAKRFGRRFPAIFSGGGMAVSMLLLATILYLNISLGNTAVVLFNVFFFINTLGFLSVPFAMAPEVFPTEIRGLGSGLCVCFGYLCNFIAVKIYPDMLTGMNIEGVFCFYGSVALAGTIFVAVFLPETKGKTLKEIGEYFGKSK